MSRFCHRLPARRGINGARHQARLKPCSQKTSDLVVKRKDHRTVLNSIHLWILRTGVPLERLPQVAVGMAKQLQGRFVLLAEIGLVAVPILQQQADSNSTGTSILVDGGVIRAHQHAAGAKKGLDRLPVASAAKQVQQRSFSDAQIQHQIHLRCDGILITKPTVGERHEAVVFEPLMEL